MRHPPPTLFLGLLLPALLLAGPALAQTGVDMSWSALDPGDDWAATVVRSVFPVGGTSGTVSTGNAATVVGTLVRYLTGFVSTIAMVFLIYSLIMQMWRGAETGRLLTDGMSGMFALRLGFAAIFMFPLASGFSAGQAAVVQASMWGIGMARTVYTSAVQAIGADARVIADPIVPGTRTIVAGLIRNEFCRALVNAASNNPGLVPAPTPVVTRYAATRNTRSITYETWNYRLSAGNESGAPVCGSVTLQVSGGNDGAVAGVSLDMGTKQREILTTVIDASIRPQVQQAAQLLYATRRANALEPLQGVLMAATADYTTRLTAAATQAMSQLRNTMADARGSGANADASQTRLAALGWSSAGAYYLEFSRLNGATLSLMSSVPSVTKPTGQGLGQALTADLLPFTAAVETFMNRMTAHVATVDQVNTPIGGATLFAGASPAEDGAGLIDRLFRYMNLGESLLGIITNYLLAPGVSVWTDPFGSLMQVGHAMITAGLGALGAAGVAVGGAEATTTATGGVPLVGGLLGATSAGIGKALEFFSPAIFALASGLLLPGLTIAYVLPMIPFLIWLAGVAGWLILVCEAVIAVPLWMLAHMTMRGEGLHGKATEGYSLAFNVLFRPVLMLLGLFLGYFIFASMSWLLRQGFGVAAGFVLGNGWVVTNVIGVIVLMCIFVLCHVVLAIMSFRMISLVPHHVPRLIGFLPANRVDMDGFSRDAALVGAAGALSQVQKAAQASLAPSQKLLGDAAKGGEGESRAAQDARRDGMDSTMRATTDLSEAPKEG
ncbi:DotA protein (plasmid) [Roseomonas mucosa]|nr:DotA protein [Roseomonas mucosa]